MNRADKILIAVIGLLLVYWIIILLFPSVLSPIDLSYNLFKDFSILIGYPGVFLISLLGNATILVPFPYIGVPFFMGSDPYNPWITGILAGLGAMLGEMTGYFTGYLGRNFLETEKTDLFLDYINKYPQRTPLIVWFLAVTPLPDDFFIVPLGVARYSWVKVFLTGVVGKVMFLTGVAWAGRLGLTWIETLVVNDGSVLSRSMEVFALILVVVAIYLLTKIDWSAASEGRILKSKV